MIEGNLRIPKILSRLFKPFVIGNYWDEKMAKEISDLIEGDRYWLSEWIELNFLVNKGE